MLSAFVVNEGEGVVTPVVVGVGVGVVQYLVQYRYTYAVSGYLTIRNIRRLFLRILIYLDHPPQLSVSTRWQNSHLIATIRLTRMALEPAGSTPYFLPSRNPQNSVNP